MRKLIQFLLILTFSLGAQSIQLTKEEAAMGLAQTLAHAVPYLPIDVGILSKQLAWNPNTALVAHVDTTEARLRETVVRLRLAANSVKPKKLIDLGAEERKRALEQVTLEDVLEALERVSNCAENK